MKNEDLLSAQTVEDRTKENAKPNEKIKSRTSHLNTNSTIDPQHPTTTSNDNNTNDLLLR